MILECTWPIFQHASESRHTFLCTTRGILNLDFRFHCFRRPANTFIEPPTLILGQVGEKGILLHKIRSSHSFEENELNQCPGRLLGIISQNPSDSKSNWLHVAISRFFIIRI
jgi:hypothetical protein